MADTISDEESKAIAAFRGKVKKIKPGVSGVTVDGLPWLQQKESKRRVQNRQRKFERAAEKRKGAK